MKKKKSSAAVRLGVIGVGGMGSNHARSIQEGHIPGARLTAVADISPRNLERWQGVAKFSDPQALIRSGTVDAVMIVTPHFSHAPLCIAAFKAGLHVLVEKPLTVRKSDAEKMIAAHRKTDRVFAIMFNQRTDPLYCQLRQWLADGTTGPIQRIQWTMTDWFRPEAYYQLGSWRGTWAGEGGGILMNQSPHQLDLWQWLFGMPKRLRAIGSLGRYHAIEVEDDVAALLEYANGATGVLVTTTGEAPGVNRLEVAADNGLLILEGRTLRFLKNGTPASAFSRSTREPFSKPPCQEESHLFEDAGPQHRGILANFVEAIRDGVPLIAPGEEGIRALELANALTVSLLRDKTVTLPLKAAEFGEVLDSLIRKHAVPAPVSSAKPRRKKAAAPLKGRASSRRKARA